MPIELYENGLSAINFFGFPKRRQFIPWSCIDKVEPFAYPHWKSRRKNSGFILWYGDKFIVIYQELENFKEFLIQLRSHFEKFPEMDRWIDPPHFGKLSGNVLGTFSYKPTGRYFAYFMCPIFILMGVYFAFIYPIIYSIEIDYFNLQPHRIKGMALILGTLWGWALLGFFLGRKRYVLLQPIILTEGGIQGPLVDRKHKLAWYWQKPTSVFFRWSDIYLMNRFKYGADTESGVIERRNGIRLMAGLNKIAIYDHISSFPEVESILKEKLPHLASSLDEEK